MEIQHFETFKIYRLRFICRTLSLLEQGPFWGSALHGILGQNLYKNFCTNKNIECADCSSQAECKYQQIFHPVLPPDHEHAKKYADLPQAFIIQKDMFDKVVFMPGDQFAFDFIVVGNAINELIHFIDAFAKAGEVGMGRMRGKFEIIQMLYDTSGAGNFDPLYPGQKPLPLNSNDFFSLSQKVSKAEVWFVTPLYLKEKGRFTHKPPLELLLNRIYERAMLLNHFYCGGEFIEAAQIPTHEIQASYQLENYAFGRFSNRHEKHLKLKGMMGKITLQGDLTSVLPLLQIGQLLNIGKMATLGLGQYRLAYG